MNQENKLGTMPISRLIWNVSLPIIASMLVQALYNIIDSIFVSYISESALAAVGLTFPTQQLIIAVAAGTATGISALMGRALGAGNQKRANEVATNGIFLALMSGLVFCLVGIFGSHAFFAAQTNVADIVDQGTLYMTIVCIGSVGICCEITYERLLQSTGRSILSMCTQGFGTIINLVLDPIFIFVLDMGVAGAALATITGQIGSALLAVYLNNTKNKEIHISFRRFRPNGKLIRSIYAIGIPSIIMISIASVMVFFMNKILISFHSAKETAATMFGVYFKVNSFIFMPIFGLNTGIISIIAYNYGAREKQRMEETIHRSVLYAVLIMIVGTIIFETVPHVLLQMFNATPTMLAVGIPALRIIGLSFPMAGAGILLSGAFQAVGKSVYSMIVSIIRQLVVLLPVALVLALIGRANGMDDLVWWSFPISEAVSFITSGCFYFRLHRKIISQIDSENALI